MTARLMLLEGQALNDLGHAREALARLDAALHLSPSAIEGGASARSSLPRDTSSLVAR